MTVAARNGRRAPFVTRTNSLWDWPRGCFSFSPRDRGLRLLREAARPVTPELTWTLTPGRSMLEPWSNVPAPLVTLVGRSMLEPWSKPATGAAACVAWERDAVETPNASPTARATARATPARAVPTWRVPMPLLMVPVDADIWFSPRVPVGSEPLVPRTGVPDVRILGANEAGEIGQMPDGQRPGWLKAASNEGNEEGTGGGSPTGAGQGRTRDLAPPGVRSGRGPQGRYGTARSAGCERHLADTRTAISSGRRSPGGSCSRARRSRLPGPGTSRRSVASWPGTPRRGGCTSRTRPR